MDSTSPNDMSPDNSDVKPSFHNPSNDAANRKYRRHSPVTGLDSSSSDGSPNHERDHSPIFLREDRKKMDDWRRKDDGRELDRDYSRNRSGRVSDSNRYSDRKTYSNSHDHRRHDDYSRHHKNADEEEKTYQRSFKSSRESRSGSRSEHIRQESYSDRSREHWRSVDKYSRDKMDSGGHRSKDKERDATVLEHHKFSDKDLSSDKAVSGSRYTNSYKDGIKTGDRDSQRDRGGREDKRDHHRSPVDYKNGHTSSYGEMRGHLNDSIEGRDRGGICVKETHRSSNKEVDGRKEDVLHKRKYDDREHDRPKEKYSRKAVEDIQYDNRSTSSLREKTEGHEFSIKMLKSNHSKEDMGPAEDGEKFPSSSRQVKDTAINATSEISSSASQAEASHDLNAAKVAAMKAAELVNRNLVGGACLSTDQKKKLLWGNKKNPAAEESGSRWDLTLFADRERQEKFNKLMGVKGDVKLEPKPDDMGGSLQAEKQKELQMDLEKQYTAGLRRRDGRTVGLGL